MKRRKRDPIGKYGAPRAKVLSVSSELGAYAYELRQRAQAVEHQQPASTARTMSREYRYAAEAVEAVAKRIRHHANRVGF